MSDQKLVLQPRPCADEVDEDVVVVAAGVVTFTSATGSTSVRTPS